MVELHENAAAREPLDRLARLDANARDAGRRRDEEVAVSAGDNRRLQDATVLPPFAPDDANLKHNNAE